ncbi:MAG: hypothetical protein V4550_15700 [Gemmatimonadota bacterium]
MVKRPIFDAMEEWRAYRDDLQGASYSTFESIMSRYTAQFAFGSILGDLAEAELPSVDFPAWWAEAQTTMGGMVGSGTLSWPVERRARVALQRQLLIGMAAGEPSLHGVAYLAFYAGGRFDDQIRAVVAQVVEPFHRDLTILLQPHLQSERVQSLGAQVSPAASSAGAGTRPSFVSEERIAAFRALDQKAGFDLRKLISLCDEANWSFQRGAWYSVAFLTRALLDHIPPAFGQETFAQVASNEPGRSFKDAASALQTFARKVADLHLHSGLRDHELLPNESQVYHAPALDLVLGEVERRLNQRATLASASAEPT